MKLELSVRASDLPGGGIAAAACCCCPGNPLESDPFAVVTLVKLEPQSPPLVLGRTEALDNDSDPRWKEVFVVEDYSLGVPTKVLVTIVDENRLTENDPIGTVAWNLRDIVAAKGHCRTKALKSQDQGTVTIQARELVGDGTMKLQLWTLPLKKKKKKKKTNKPESADGAEDDGVDEDEEEEEEEDDEEDEDEEDEDDDDEEDDEDDEEGPSPAPVPLWSIADPFFQLARRKPLVADDDDEDDEDSKWEVVYSSPKVVNETDPHQPWDPVQFPVGVLIGYHGQGLNQASVKYWQAPIRIQLFDYATRELKGQVTVTVQDLFVASHYYNHGDDDDDRQTLPVYHEDQTVGNLAIVRVSVDGIDGVDVTQLLEPPPDQAIEPTESDLADVQQAETNEENMELNLPYVPPPPPEKARPTFLSYIAGGCQLNVVVAIDFTGSNGDPHEPGTLHYYSDDTLNDYEKALKYILEILASYDSDQKYPVLGFGAKYDGVVQHCFQCGSEPEAHGVAGVLEAYKDVFSSGLVMSSPTVYTEVIDTAAARARTAAAQAAENNQQVYTILLILSDGAVSDPEATAESLINAADAPLSVVMVGIGDKDDFSAMQFLDDLETDRDIAQFVQFNQHQSSSVALTSATLDEIPSQLVSYFEKRGIEPLPPLKVGSDQEIPPVDKDDEEEDIVFNLNFQDDRIIADPVDFQYGKEFGAALD